MHSDSRASYLPDTSLEPLIAASLGRREGAQADQIFSAGLDHPPIGSVPSFSQQEGPASSLNCSLQHTICPVSQGLDLTRSMFERPPTMCPPSLEWRDSLRIRHGLLFLSGLQSQLHAQCFTVYTELHPVTSLKCHTTRSPGHYHDPHITDEEAESDGGQDPAPG